MENKDNTFCACGYYMVNGRCSRKYPVKACKGEQIDKRIKYSGATRRMKGAYEDY